MRLDINDPTARRDLKSEKSLFSCDPVIFEKDHPIEKIPPQILPNKKYVYILNKNLILMIN